MTTPGGTAGGLTYTYLPDPTVIDVDPTTGPTTGGTPVTITGSDLTHTDTVTFDGIPASFAVISDTTIVTTTPPHPAGQAVPPHRHHTRWPEHLVLQLRATPRPLIRKRGKER